MEKELWINDKYIPLLEDTIRHLGLYGGGGCFTADTLVLTERGHKPISEIQIGDFVLSHEGNVPSFQRIVKTFRHSGARLGKNMITFISIDGNKITSTENHEYRIDGKWISAFELSRRIMGASPGIQWDLLCQQFRQTTHNQLEGKANNQSNEASPRRIRIFKDNDLQRWRLQDNQDTQADSQNVHPKPRKQAAGQSPRLQQTKQFCSKSSVGDTRREQSALLEFRKDNNSVRGANRHLIVDRTTSRGDQGEIQEASLHSRNVRERVFSKDINDKRYCSAKELDPCEVIEIQLSEAPEFVYDLCVGYNHNYTVSRENIIVHNSGKSVFAAQKVVNRVLCEKPHKFLVLRKVADTIKESVFAEIQEAIAQTDCAHEFEVNKTEKTFLHRPTGNRILCKGLDEPEKIKSIKGITGMWIEEATEFTLDDLAQLNLRIRGEKANYIQFIYTFNPISEDNEVVKKFVMASTLPPDTKVIHTTYHDNFFLSEEDKQQFEALKLSNPLFYDVYCLGIPGVVDKSGKFLYTFNGQTNVAKGIPMDPNLPLWVTFDFNIDPMTATIGQRFDQETLCCFKSIQLPNSDVHAICDVIKTDYNGWHLICTGDASGNNESGVTRGKSSYWKEIKKELGLKDHQLKIRSKNLGLHESRVLCNVVLRTMNVFLDEDGCAPLIQECKYAKVDDRGVLIKDRNKQKNDHLDNFRYLLDANWPDIINKPNKYKKR